MVYAGELSFNKVYTRMQMLKQLCTTTCHRNNTIDFTFFSKKGVVQ